MARRARALASFLGSVQSEYQLQVGGSSLTLMCMQAVHAAQRLRHALAAPRHVALAPINSVPYPPPALGFGAV